MTPIIETHGLTKRFSTATNYRALFRLGRVEDLTAVDAVSLHIAPGELFGLLGPNGAGKTTLVKMLCTLVLPSEGRATVAGFDVQRDAAAVRQVIGLINAEERSFFWRLTGRENLKFFAALHNLHGSAANRRIAELLELTGLTAQADRRFMGYSSGMRQKLAVARGLLSLPPIILMDEPTRSLDPVSARELRDFVRRTLVEKMGRTVLLVTHRLEEAESLCDRVAIMNHGRIVACGPVTDIKRRVAARRRYRLQVSRLPAAALNELRALPGVADVQARNGTPDTVNLALTLADEARALPPALRYIVAHGADILRCETEPVSLEEAFVHLVQEAAGE